MVRAAQNLEVPLYNSHIAPLEVHFLTGKKYWYQTIFCMYSLQKTTQLEFEFHLYDDGTFDETLIEQMKRQASRVRIHTIDKIEARLLKALPPNEFPFLWHKRKVYPHIRKLTDVHAGATGWKMVMDSDMLFFQFPFTVLESWLLNPEANFYIEDVVTSYGYSAELMENLSGAPIPEKINVGIIGLKSEDINWAKVEAWGSELEKREGTSYYLEQALTAMLIGQQPATIGHREEGFIVMPSKEEVLGKEGVVHHYVDLSKEWYFKKAWRYFTP